MFIDQARILVHAGSGGNGCVSFRREKFVPQGGPDGGDGGKGGDLYPRATHRLNTLLDFRYKRHFKSQRGAHGSGANRTGRSGEDLIVEVPPEPRCLTRKPANCWAIWIATAPNC